MPAPARTVDPAAQGRPAPGPLLAAAVLVATVAQLAVGSLASGLEQFDGKGFTARLVAYPALMLVVPLGWALARRRTGSRAQAPWTAFVLIMLPFLVDVTGNTLDLYDGVSWWDDANHLVNWFLLSSGAGLLLRRSGIRPRWALGLLVAGLGALLAVAWEVAEWWTFIRHSSELATAYQDTLGDEVLGSLGAALAGVLVARQRRGT